jgi:hypothetical protein
MGFFSISRGMFEIANLVPPSATADSHAEPHGGFSFGSAELRLASLNRAGGFSFLISNF